LARAAGATVVFEPINQIARARNKGAEAATGDWIIFVDADSHPSEALFTDVAEAIKTGKYIYGGCTITLDGNYPKARMVTALWNWVSRVKKWAAGSFIFCETAAFREIGGFNKELFAGEELDLSNRLWRLARKKGKGAVILRRHPLVTSARKMHLYKPGDHLWFLAKIILTGGRAMRNREACYVWYDGKR
jgi:glycosyltransferase involved in cell wall biosynthesis